MNKVKRETLIGLLEDYGYHKLIQGHESSEGGDKGLANKATESADIVYRAFVNLLDKED